MSELLQQLLVAVITACLPILTAYLVGIIRKQGAVIAEKTDSEIAKDYLARITDAVARAVTYTNQTYVDSMKASGTFTKESQMEAFTRALDAAMTILGPEVLEWIDDIAGNAQTYLSILIEAAVKDQKSS